MAAAALVRIDAFMTAEEAEAAGFELIVILPPPIVDPYTWCSAPLDAGPDFANETAYADFPWTGILLHSNVTNDT